ncbi:hypothetical protein GF322_01310 [Candidatus Dependentiae bacterium]|nr:hypothetical protein [Candidatus Dependentiae bacterium]
MEYSIYLRCFLIGILASSSLGPIFILTFNRGALYGFGKAFATAFGSCISDTIYFFLGLMGILTILQESKSFMFWLDTAGGFLLILFGIYTLRKGKYRIDILPIEGRLGTFLIILKSFIITALNPFVLLFFMFIGVQVLPTGVISLSLRQVIFCSLMVFTGSLSVLSLVSLISSFIGNCISPKWLKFISIVTGIIFIVVGLYFLDHLFRMLFF